MNKSKTVETKRNMAFDLHKQFPNVNIKFYNTAILNNSYQYALNLNNTRLYFFLFTMFLIFTNT